LVITPVHRVRSASSRNHLAPPSVSLLHQSKAATHPEINPLHKRDLTAEYPGPQRIVDLIRRGARLYANREVIVTPTARMTFFELDLASRALAKRLVAAGAGKGTRVAVHLPHSVEWIVSFFAVTRIAAVFMPFSAAYKASELRRALRLGDAHLLIAGTESWHGGPYAEFLLEALPELDSAESQRLQCTETPFLREIWMFGPGAVPRWARAAPLEARPTSEATVSDQLLDALEEQVVPADDAMIIWTSGTTADPKGAIHTQATVARRAKANAHSHAFVPDDRVFCDYAFWWVGGPGYGFLPAIWAGATTLAVPRHHRDSTEAFLENEQPTRVAGRLAPDIAERVVASEEGSAHMVSPRAIGMTETFGPHSMHEPTSREELLASPKSGLGPAILGFERKIVDRATGEELPEGQEGELLVRGPGMMRNLYRRERDEVFDHDGWYHTGDKCLIVDDIVHFVARFTEMIKTSGSNVAPLEVEQVISAIPEVEESVVFGIPDSRRGECVAAAIQRVTGATLDAEEVRDAVRLQLSNYKVPREVLILEDHEMPRLHSGKPDKVALKKLMSARLNADGASSEIQTPNTSR